MANSRKQDDDFVQQHVAKIFIEQGKLAAIEMDRRMRAAQEGACFLKTYGGDIADKTFFGRKLKTTHFQDGSLQKCLLRSDTDAKKEKCIEDAANEYAKCALR